MIRNDLLTSMQNWPSEQRPAFSLLELMAAVAIIGIVATIVVIRVSTSQTEANIAASHAQQGDIEVQVQLWRRNFGSFPAADLSNIGADISYFPEGVPMCPVDGTPYTIDTATGRIIGHDH